MKGRTLILGTLLLSACSERYLYDSAQGNHALECQKYPDARYEECMATVEQDYEDYRRERDALSSDDSPR